MSIYLGNLTIEEMEKRIGSTFSSELRTLLEETREEECSKVKGNRKWHCYDIPFMLECGTYDFAKELYDKLKDLSYNETMQIGVNQDVPDTNVGEKGGVE